MPAPEPDGSGSISLTPRQNTAAPLGRIVTPIVIGIAATPISPPGETFEFDPVGFARSLAAERHQRGWSTRELARRADLSQTYIVTLEGALRAGARRAVPTVDVLTRLAGAFGSHPGALFASALRRRGLHVVLVLEDDHDSKLARVRRFTGDHVLDWVCATSGSQPAERQPAERQPAERQPHRSIDLHRRPGAAYDPALIARSLAQELQSVQSEIEGRAVGFLFGETSDFMAQMDDPDVILAFERQWAAVVSNAADAVSAHAVWNVCVYELDALRQLEDPVRAMVELIRNHDAVWTARGRALAAGAAAARRVLHRLRPSDTSERAWRVATDRLLAGAGVAA